MVAVDDIPKARYGWFQGLDKLLDRKDYSFHVGAISEATTHVKLKPVLKGNYLAVRLTFQQSRSPKVLVHLVLPPRKEATRANYPCHSELLDILRRDKLNIDSEIMNGMGDYNLAAR